MAEAMSPMVVRGLASSAASGGWHCRPRVIAIMACSSACRQLISILSPFVCDKATQSANCLWQGITAQMCDCQKLHGISW